MKKHQIVLIHGGSSYDTYEEYIDDLKSEEVTKENLKAQVHEGWSSTLGRALGPHFTVANPDMPNWLNAKYVEWKIWFEKLMPLFEEPYVLVGHSLGGIFVARYLGENISPKKLKAVFLLAAPYRNAGASDSLGDFITPGSLSKITDQCENVFIYHSKDDPIVSFKNYEKYVEAMPKAHGVAFEDKDHFRLKEFPELVEAIRKLYKEYSF